MISIGEGFWCNADCIINASSDIKIGDYGLWGWRCCVLDGSGHKVLPYNLNKSKFVEIGAHVWLASEVSILSGSKIGNDSIVAAKVCISKEFQDSNLLLGGFNKLLREGVSWEK